MFNLVPLGAVSFSVFLLLFRWVALCAVKKSHMSWGKSLSKLVASHLCECTGKEGVNEGGHARDVDGGGGSDVKAGMEKGQLLHQEKQSTKVSQGVRALSQDLSDWERASFLGAGAEGSWWMSSISMGQEMPCWCIISTACHQPTALGVRCCWRCRTCCLWQLRERVCIKVLLLLEETWRVLRLHTRWLQITTTHKALICSDLPQCLASSKHQAGAGKLATS